MNSGRRAMFNWYVCITMSAMSAAFAGPKSRAAWAVTKLAMLPGFQLLTFQPSARKNSIEISCAFRPVTFTIHTRFALYAYALLISS